MRMAAGGERERESEKGGVLHLVRGRAGVRVAAGARACVYVCV